MSAKSIAKKAFKANAITEEEYKQLLCVIKLSDESLRQKGVWINAPTIDTTCPNYDSGYAQGYSDGYLKGKEERPHGEWIEHYDNSDGFTWLTCSRCMFKAYEEDYNFCPNCGAEMRKEEKDG